MKKYIDKDALIAEIERQKAQWSGMYSDYFNGQIKAYSSMLYLLNTLEVKEASSIWNDARKTIPEDSSNKKKIPNQIICIKEDDLAVATIGRLVNGTKKWAYLNDLLNISDVQLKEVDLDNELDFVKDAYYYFTSDERDSMMKVARHFFDLGLNAQKGNGRNN